MRQSVSAEPVLCRLAGYPEAERCFPLLTLTVAVPPFPYIEFISDLSAVNPDSTSPTPGSLLGPADPPPFRTLGNDEPQFPLLLVCDHASSTIPAALNNLGLDEALLNEHIALDIGAAAVTQRLAEKLGVPAVFCNYSRLVVDCNRPLAHRHAFPDYSDNTPVPGNQDLSDADKQQRIDAIFHGYHNAVAEGLQQLQSLAPAPAIIAIHSFTPTMDGYQRPWHCGILWDKDERLAVPMIKGLRNLQSFEVGDNEPYSGRHPEDYTLDFHGEQQGLPHVAVELRQDLIAHDAGAEQWAGILAAVLKPLLHDEQLFAARMDWS